MHKTRVLSAFLFALSAQAEEARVHRVGMQSFQLLDTVFVDGGYEIYQNGSAATLRPELVAYDLSVDFGVPGPPSQTHPKPLDVPSVADGYMWSNLVDKAWLFGGQLASTPSFETVNNVWRFERTVDGDEWTNIVDLGVNTTIERPFQGAGCSVPDLQKGFYLGGVNSGHDDAHSAQVLHWLYIFDMETETLKTLPVPEFVPVVNQSLVFVDTGTRSGALVVLGGLIERNRVLTLTPSTSIFIFDIESETWVEQETTGQDGGVAEDNSSYLAPSTDVPRARMSACAAVGSAQDKTSHNILFIGGQNATHALGDAWILSLPSGLWFKAPYDAKTPYYDVTMSAKARSSCSLLSNARHVLMIGGCYLEGGIPCKDHYEYTWAFDMKNLGYGHFSYRVELGYFVPDKIVAVIGGTPTGQAEIRDPSYTSFAHQLLKDLFTPPASIFPAEDPHYGPLVQEMTTLLLALPVVLATLHYSFILATRTVRGLRAKVTPKPEHRRPWAFQSPYLVFLTSSTICLIAIVQFLKHVSEQPDPIFEHWSGGVDSDGIWTGPQFTSHFIRSPSLSRPRSGIVSSYYDTGTGGIWSQKNNGIRLGRGGYFAFIFLPMLLAVVYGRMWKLLDDQVKRIDTFYRLQSPHGCPAATSLCLDYHAFWSPLSVVQALRYRHWTVAISSIGAVAGSITVPLTLNYVFEWEVHSGGRSSQPVFYSWRVGLVNPYWADIATSQLAVGLVCSAWLLWLLPGRKTGLKRDPRGIANILSLIPDQSADPSSPFTHDLNHKSTPEIQEALQSLTFRIAPSRSNPSRLVLESIPAKLPYSKPTTVRPRLQRLSARIIRPIQMYIDSSPTSFLFRRPVHIIWLLILSTLVAFAAQITASMNRNARDNWWDYGLPFPTDVYLVVGILILSTVDVIDFHVRASTPYLALMQGYQPPSILWADYTTGIPLWEILVALYDGHYLLGFSMLATVATVVYTIFLGSLQLSSSNFGGTTFESDLSAATACTLLGFFILAVNVALGWRFSFSRPGGLIRPPVTIAASLPYVVFSGRLRGDFEGVVGEGEEGDQIREMGGLGRRYGMGRFGDGFGGELFGVERQYDDGGYLR